MADNKAIETGFRLDGQKQVGRHRTQGRQERSEGRAKLFERPQALHRSRPQGRPERRTRGPRLLRARATALKLRNFREERDTWVNWLARTADLMSAELGVEAHPKAVSII